GLALQPAAPLPSVNSIADHRMTHVRQMHPYLVCSSCFKPHSQQGKRSESLFDLVVCDRSPPSTRMDGESLSVSCIAAKREIDTASSRRGFSVDQRKVFL